MFQKLWIIFNIQVDREDEAKIREMTSILNGRFINGDGAKTAFDAMMERIKNEGLKDKGEYVNVGEERTRIAEEGGELVKPAPLVLSSSRNNNKEIIPSELESEKENPDGSIGDYID